PDLQEQPEPTAQDERLSDQTPEQPRKSYFSNAVAQAQSNPLNPDLALPRESAEASAPQLSAPGIAPAAPASTLAQDSLAQPVSRAAPQDSAEETTAAASQASGKGAMPPVSAFLLPIGELHAVAQSSGLSWVNSDPAKVASVQAAIAAEPRPIHVPRQRSAPAVLEDGPLVLVETRRDLRELTLPFETPSAKP
ncbi:MAG: ribonuclease E/G, partial [Burkholderiales bacterium]|nr:ribonuclease E/G [Burkholderiales bacterium]